MVVLNYTIDVCIHHNILVYIFPQLKRDNTNNTITKPP